jgi:molecular chaperone DnaK (HSP70)
VSENPFLAIDFGTTNSVMAWINKDGQAEVVNNAEHEPKTPSLVYYGEDGTLVGKYAAAFIEDEMRFLEPDAQQRETTRIMRSIKRLLGQSTLIALPGGQMLRPVDVAAEIFKKLKRDAEDGIFHEPVRRAVVTYPAAFDPIQREAIKQAARQAGFEDVRLLAEPEAAALAYTRLGRAVGEGVLVYDLGGGTFDLSVLSRDSDDGMYRLALENEGDARLGGDDIDQLLYDHCLKLAVGQFGADIPAFDIQFLYDCRKRKENLSGSALQTFSNLFNGRPFRHKMDRSEFEALIEPLIGRTVRKTQQMLKRAEEAGVKVDTLVLIGGSSCIPLIETSLQAVLPIAPLKFHQADCAVALGAAYYGRGPMQPDPIDDGTEYPDLLIQLEQALQSSDKQQVVIDEAPILDLAAQVENALKSAGMPSLDTLLNELKAALRSKNLDRADQLSMQIIRAESGYLKFDSEAKSKAIPADVLRKINKCWTSLSTEKMSARPWVCNAGEFADYTGFWSLTTWVGQRLKSLGIN